MFASILFLFGGGRFKCCVKENKIKYNRKEYTWPPAFPRVSPSLYKYNKSLRKISLACREHEKVGDGLFTHYSDAPRLKQGAYISIEIISLYLNTHTNTIKASNLSSCYKEEPFSLSKRALITTTTTTTHYHKAAVFWIYFVLSLNPPRHDFMQFPTTTTTTKFLL